MFVHKLKKNIIDNKYIFKFCYILIALICCYLTLRPLQNQISESIRILCYVLCIFSIYTWDAVSPEVNEIFDKPWEKIIKIILEIYGTVAFTGIYFLKSTIQYEIIYPKLVYFMLSFCWVCPIIKCFIALLSRSVKLIEISKHETKLSTRLVLIGIMMIPCIIFLIAFNPAITSPDSMFCYNMAHNPTAGMLDWHPPFYIFVLSLLLKICDSISFLIIVQDICFCAVFVDGILFLYRCGFSKKLLGLLYIFITFGVSNIIQLVTLWKDIPYMISLLWLTLLLIKIVMRWDEYKNNWSWYVQFILAVVFTCLFRQNGILPAGAVLILLPFIAKFSKKSIISCITCLILIVLVKGPLYQFMNIESAPQLKFFSLANDMMYPYYIGSPVSEEVMEIINKITNDDPDNWVYNPYDVSYNKEEPSGYSTAEFMRIYCKSIIQNPKEMVMAVATRNAVIWSIARPNDECAGCVNHLEEWLTDATYPPRVYNKLTYVITDFCNWIKNNTLLYLFLWRTGIYNLLILIMLAVTVCKQNKQKLFHLFPYVPIIMNLAALFIASGWSDYRYFWPSMTISLFLMFFFIYDCRRCFDDIQKTTE